MNESNYPDLILGKWQLVKEEMYYKGELESSSTDVGYGTLFSSSGDCTWGYTHAEYSITGNWVLFVNGNHAEEWRIQKLSRKELILVDSYSETEEWSYFMKIE